MTAPVIESEEGDLTTAEPSVWVGVRHIQALPLALRRTVPDPRAALGASTI